MPLLCWAVTAVVCLPLGRVCDEGVRKEPHLVGNRDSQLAGREQGDSSRGWRGSPTSRTHRAV